MPTGSLRPCFAVAALLLLSAAKVVAEDERPRARSSGARRPNFLLILTDDLDAALDSSGEAAMPAMKRLLSDKGATFTSHFVSHPICCPSRVNLLRGQLSHNTNFTDVLGPHGGYAKFRALGLDREWLPTWLQREGYRTLYTGKFIVDYTIKNKDPPPAGWTVFDALVHPFTFEYYSPAFALNGGPPRMYPAQYTTDVLRSKALALLRSAAADPEGVPFFLQVAPPAPHHSMSYVYDANGTFVERHWYPPVPAARHWELLSDAVLPRPPSFNDPQSRGKPMWLRDMERLTPGNVTFLEEVFRLRLRSLRAVDELLAALVSELEVLGLADSTYVMFTSDNGYHEGAHRMGSGKTTSYEEDLRVPLIVAGPGVRPGTSVADTTLHVDLAPTVLALAGAPLPPWLDGTPLPLELVGDGGLPAPYPPTPRGPGECGPALRNQFVAEFWGEWADESIHTPSRLPYRNHTWRAVRVLRYDHAEAYKYVVHCSGEHELYDLARDPYERTNLLYPQPAGTSSPSSGSGSGSGSSSSAEPDSCSSHEQPAGVLGAAVGKMAAAVGVLRAWGATAWAAATHGSTRSSRAGGNPEPVGPPPCGARGAAGVRGAARQAGRPCECGGLLVGRARCEQRYVAWLGRLRSRLDALLAVLAVCAGADCTEPFKVLHPDGGVRDLWAAMDPAYDNLYDSVLPFRYLRCLPYQDVSNELSPFRRGNATGASGQAGGARSSDPGGMPREGERAAGGEQVEGAGGEGGRQLAPFRMAFAADVEDLAVPLPLRYQRIADVYGATASTDAQLLA